MAISGVGAYLFLALAGRSLGPERFAALGALWATVFLVASAVLGPLEIVIARAVATARGRGEPPEVPIRAGLRVAIVIGVGAVTAAVFAGSVVDELLYAGMHGFALAGAAAVAGLAFGAVAKGAFAATDHLAGWGGYLLVDAATRLGIGLAAAVLASGQLAFALALAVGPWAAAAVASGRLSRLLPSANHLMRARQTTHVARATGILVVGATAAATLTYVGPLLIPALVVEPDAHVGGYVAALSLARLPLFLVTPAIAVVLPRIAISVARSDFEQVRVTARRFISVALGSSIAIGLLSIIAGERIVAVMFGNDFVVPERSLVVAGFASGCWLFATAASSVTISVGRASAATASWCIALLAAGVAFLASGPDAFERTDATVCAGAATAALGAAVTVYLAVLRNPALTVQGQPSRPAPS